MPAMPKVRTKPVTLLAFAHALLGCALAFGLVEFTTTQLVAVQGLFASLGFGGASLVTANARLDPKVVAAAKGQPWAGPLTLPPALDDDV